MKKHTKVILILFVVSIYSCGTVNNTSTTKANLGDELIEENRANITLLQRIRQKRGIIVSNNIPRLSSANNSFDSGGNQEPLYVVNKQIIGNSFTSVDEIIDSYSVKSIKILKGAEASSYGSQGANGVILITLY